MPASVLRVTTYNINEGRYLDTIAKDIRRSRADIVLLNEVMFRRVLEVPAANWPGSSSATTSNTSPGTRSIRTAATSRGNWTGLTGIKLTAILSRFPMGPVEEIDTWLGLRNIGFDTLRAPITVAGRTIHLYSLRWPANSQVEALQCAQNAVASLRRLPQNDAVILGGDLNADKGDPTDLTYATYQYFSQQSGLRHATGAGIDQIYFRGPWTVVAAGDMPGASDHGMIWAEFVENFTAIYGGVFKIAHDATSHRLHSHARTYGHPNSSGQQQVTAFAGADDNDWWRISGAHGTPADRQGQPVRHGDVIRLTHVGTGRNPHSHRSLPSPVTPQQEVTAYGTNGQGDGNDDWRVEVGDGSDPLAAWTSTIRVRLIHVHSAAALHSHTGFSHPQWTAGQQEVTGFTGRDGNDLWYLAEMR